ncbi:MAG: hypothetical protein JSU09_06260 [Bacteroidetes bacterium]|nr:hypothetical protein [Bacteroidota bacterium]
MNILHKVTWVFFVCSNIQSPAICQDEDSHVIRVVTKATTSGIDFHKECHQPALFFSIVVSFKKHCKVDTVLFSGLPKCIESERQLLSDNVERRVNDLQLSEEQYGNKFIIILYACVLGETSGVSEYSMSQTEWTKLFKEIDIKLLKDKQLKQVTSASITVFPRIRN